MLLPIMSITLYAALASLLVGPLGATAADEEVATDGKAVGGLRIRLQLPAAKRGENVPPQCEVTLENVGERDLC